MEEMMSDEFDFLKIITKLAYKGIRFVVLFTRNLNQSIYYRHIVMISGS